MKRWKYMKTVLVLVFLALILTYISFNSTVTSSNWLCGRRTNRGMGGCEMHEGTFVVVGC